MGSVTTARIRARTAWGGAFVALAMVATSVPASGQVGDAGPPDANGPSAELISGELRAEIRRTEAGIPHVKADDWASLGYGYGYAFAEDNFCLLAGEVVAANAQKSVYFGDTSGNRNDDFFHRLIIDQGLIEEALGRPADAIPPGPTTRVRELIAGTAVGYNRYLSDVGGPDGLSDPACQGGAWVREIDEIDLWRVYLDSSVRAGLGALDGEIVNTAPPGAPANDAAGAEPTRTLDEVFKVDTSEFGSNAYGLGAEATVDGTGMLLGNPHFPWDGRDRFYEMHLTIPGEYDMIGAALSGQPVVEIGHNETMGWSHTVSTARRFTLFQLELVPGNPTQYIVDGEIRDMERNDIEIEVDDGAGGTTTATRTLWTSDYGPLVEVSVLEWNDTTAYAVKDVNEDSGRTFDGYIEMGQASSVRELKSVLDTWQHLPWINTIAADADGEAFYGDHSVVPNVDDDQLARCLTPTGKLVLPLAGIFVLDGADSTCEWDTDPDSAVPGILGPSRLPTIFRDDYVTNSNDSYWLSNPEEPLEGFSRIIGVEGTERSLRTRLGVLQVQERIAGTDDLAGEKFTLDNLQDVMFSNRVYGAELVRDDLVATCRANPTVVVDAISVDLTEACEVLDRWDMRVDLDSRGAHVFQEFASARGIVFEVPFDIADPINTPNTLAVGDPKVLEALGRAVLRFTNDGIALDARLGDIQSEPRNDEVIPIHGGSGGAGAFNVISPRYNGPEGYNDIRAGASIILAAEFTPEGPKSRALLSYSNSTDPTSDHYADQTRRYSEKDWVTLRYHEADILADPELEITELVEPAPLPVLTPGVDRIVEGTGFWGGPTIALVPVTLSHPSDQPITFDWITAEWEGIGRAQARFLLDYFGRGGTVTIKPGATSAVIPVLIRRDRRDETDEYFFVGINKAQGATIGGEYGLGGVAILDDDGTDEGQGGPSPFAALLATDNPAE